MRYNNKNCGPVPWVHTARRGPVSSGGARTRPGWHSGSCGPPRDSRPPHAGFRGCAPLHTSLAGEEWLVGNKSLIFDT